MTSEAVVRVHLRTSAGNALWHKDLPFALSLSEGLQPRGTVGSPFTIKELAEVSPRKQSQEMVRGEISSQLRCSS